MFHSLYFCSWFPFHGSCCRVAASSFTCRILSTIATCRSASPMPRSSFGGPVTDNHLGLDIVQARWFHIVGVSIYFFEQLIYTMKFYMNEWRLVFASKLLIFWQIKATFRPWSLTFYTAQYINKFSLVCVAQDSRRPLAPPRWVPLLQAACQMQLAFCPTAEA